MCLKLFPPPPPFSALSEKERATIERATHSTFHARKDAASIPPPFHMNMFNVNEDTWHRLRVGWEVAVERTRGRLCE